ncbi:acyltransferase family protein [Nocardioides sp. SYSU D00038]|uniref:acyltransferase family protein n=1 Tax=Nocardioides sp. SYSU D00038 TaxID=2812554 RepID=UPI0019673928|nr:acyltransferase family protein [Nocardioides sp. SYSU D00038]
MHLGFRQDIQGLRALAVLLVALDHARIGPFHGGFVGVDVFFVISGYLITSLLVAEAERSDTVSLLGFYGRRARRILPAATVVLVFTVVGSIAVLSAVEAKSAVDYAVWATFFATNFKLVSDGTDYFNAEAAASPFQHYWSLAVEEQFYLVWPVVVIGLCWWMRREADDRASARHAAGRRAGYHPGALVRAAAVPVLLAIVVASFVWCVVHTRTDPVSAYYSPFTRAWELCLGALAACLAPAIARGVPAWLFALASWAGVLAVLAAALTFDSTTLFPGHLAALPVLGTVLLLLGGLGPAAWGPQRLLTVAPMRAVGDWSYSLYLWHWPLLIFAGALWGRPSGLYGAAVVVVAVVLAAASYRWVENPFRRGQGLPRAGHLRGVLLYPAVVLVTLPLVLVGNRVVDAQLSGGGPPVTLSEYGQSEGDPPPEFSDDPVVALVQASVLAAQNGMAIPADLEPSLLGLADDRPDVGECEYFQINEDRPLCPRGDPDADRTLVLLGDSHARQWMPALDVLTERFGYTAYYLVREGCPSADVTPWLKNGTGPSTACAAFQDWAVDQVEELDPDVVLMASEANPAFADDDGNLVDDVEGKAELFRVGMERQVARVAPHTDRVVIIGDPPALRLSPAGCLSERDADLGSCLSGEDPTSLTMIDALRQAARATDTPFVETGQWFCASEKCPTVIGRYIARRDRAHISTPYSAYLADELEARIRLGPVSPSRR